MAPFTLQVGDYELVGRTVAGTGTCIAIPSLKLAFDTAQGLPFSFSMKNYFITHSHMDHAGGIPYIISQKALMGIAPGTFYMPKSMISSMTKIVEQWAQMEGYEYQYKFIPTQPGQAFELTKHLYVKVFRTCHRVPSNGYCVFLKKKKLKSRFRGFTQEQIIALKDKKEVLHETMHSPEIAFTGDTTIDFLMKDIWVLSARILIMEVTYAGQERTIEHSRKWGHTHLEEVAHHIDKIKSEWIVLIHQSSRFSDEFFLKQVKEIIPTHHQHRILIFPRR